MGKKKDKIPPPGNKKDPYTNFMKKAKWMQVWYPCISNADLPTLNCVQVVGL